MIWGCANANQSGGGGFIQTIDAKLASGGGLSSAEFGQIKGM